MYFIYFVFISLKSAFSALKWSWFILIHIHTHVHPSTLSAIHTIFNCSHPSILRFARSYSWSNFLRNSNTSSSRMSRNTKFKLHLSFSFKFFNHAVIFSQSDKIYSRVLKFLFPKIHILSSSRSQYSLLIL